MSLQTKSNCPWWLPSPCATCSGWHSIHSSEAGKGLGRAQPTPNAMLFSGHITFLCFRQSYSLLMKKKKRSVCDSRPICCTKNLGFLLSVLDFHQSKHSPLHVLWRNTSSMNRIYHGMPTRASSILYVPALLPQVSDFLKPGKDLGLSCKQQQPKTSWRMLGVRSARQIPP